MHSYLKNIYKTNLELKMPISAKTSLKNILPLRNLKWKQLIMCEKAGINLFMYFFLKVVVKKYAYTFLSTTTF